MSAPSGFDVLVVGGGVVGLACGASLARAGRRVLLVERHDGLGRETTSRNSQVIHAGLYYPEGSLKAELCVRGRELLYERCAREGIPHAQLGKVVVATSEDQVPDLEALATRAEANGVPGLEMLDGAAVRRREPDVRAVAGLLSPRTGIVDAHSLCLSYAAELEHHEGVVALHASVEALEPGPPWRARVRMGEAEAEEIEVEQVVNAAGLASDRVAELAGLDVEALGYRMHWCKGDYFALAPAAPFRFQGLVYPMAVAGGLGVHVTLDLAGRVRFGPDVEYVDRETYVVDAAKAQAFAEVAGRYLPGLRAEWLTPDQAGLRPKLAAPGEGFRDFVVEEASAHGAPGLVNLIGIESPGLTAAGAIAERVRGLLA